MANLVDDLQESNLKGTRFEKEIPAPFSVSAENDHPHSLGGCVRLLQGTPSETPCSSSPCETPASPSSRFAYSTTLSFSPDQLQCQDSHYLHPQHAQYQSQGITKKSQYTREAVYDASNFTTDILSAPHGEQAAGFTPQLLDCNEDEIGFLTPVLKNRIPDEEFVHKSNFEYSDEDMAQPLKSVSTFSSKGVENSLKSGNQQEHDILTGGQTIGFSHLQTAENEEIKNLFQFIGCYKPREVEIGTFLRPFIPDYIPAVGAVDEFIKVPRPDGVPDYLGLKVLDESGPIQSDPAVVALQMRAAAMQLSHHSTDIASIEGPERNSRKVDAWIDSMRDLQRLKPLSSVTYSKPMPDMEQLIKDFPKDGDAEMQFLSKHEDMELSTFVDLCCSSLGIPVYVEKLLHLLLKHYGFARSNIHTGGEQVQKQSGVSTLCVCTLSRTKKTSSLIECKVSQFVKFYRKTNNFGLPFLRTFYNDVLWDSLMKALTFHF